MSSPIRIIKTFSNGETAETAAYSYPNDRISMVESIIKDVQSRDALPADVITRNVNEPS